MRFFNPNFIVAAGICTSVVTLALPANVHNVSLTGDGHRRLQDGHRRLQARGFLPPPSSDEEWAKYLCKGEKLLTMMNSDDRTAGSMLEPPQGSAASQFTNFPGEFDKWFYQPFNDDQTDLGEYYYGLSDALKDMGISRRRDDWTFLRATHGDRRPGAPNLNDQTYVVNGHTYRATGAEFVVPTNAKDGALIIAKQYSPGTVGNMRRPPVEELPDLKRFSDICWGMWKMTTTNAPVRHMITWAVDNKATNAALARALKTRNGKDYLEDYPGECFLTSEEVGKALLGTPNGIGIGYFLVQHKAELGHLKVGEACVFFTDSVIFMEREMASIHWKIVPATMGDVVAG